MKKLKGRKIVTALLSAMCAVLLCFSVGLLGSHGFKSALAAAPTSAEKQLGELTLNNGNLDANNKTFNGETLTKLYDAILGPTYSKTGTYNKVKKALTDYSGSTPTTTHDESGYRHASASSNSMVVATESIPNAIDANKLRSNNGGNVFVKIGGVDFEVVYVTLDNNGDVIVDLWQATSTVTSHWSANASGGGTGYSLYHGRNNTNHPSNVYGLSYIRANTLGQGGAWDAFSSADATTHSPQSATAGGATGAYATLWNNMTTGNLSNFIVSPKDVKYQEVESTAQLLGLSTQRANSAGMAANDWWKFTLPNEAYGHPLTESYFQFGRGNTWNSTGSNNVNTGYGGYGTNQITNQDQWKNDKLWLPSLAETGHNGVQGGSGTTLAGIWGLDNSQRNNNGGACPASWNTSTSTANVSWLRSGFACDAFSAFILTSSGAMNSTYASCSLAVRPALHLNLKSAALSAASGSGSQAADMQAVNTPKDLEFTYDGIEYTDMASIIKRVETGKAKTTPDANGDFNTNGEITWFDETLHAGGGNTAGTAANTIFKTGSAIEYKIEYKQVGKTSFATPLTDFKIKNAGEYKITCYFETANKYKWRDSVTGVYDTAASKEFKITIKQLEVKYKWKSSGGKLNETDTDLTKRWKVTFDKDTFTPTAGNSAAPWVYLDYTLLSAGGIQDNANAALLTYDQTNKKSQLGGTDNDTLPCIVVKYTNTEQYDNLLQNIYVNKNGTTAPTNGTNRAFPKEAGNYTVTAEDINKDTSNYKLAPDTGEAALTSTRGYEIEKYEVKAPIKPNNPLEYSGSEQEYRVPNYNDKYMEYGTYDGSTFTANATPTDMTAGTTGADAPLTLKATKVNDYKISFQLLKSTAENTTAHPNPEVRNYKWKDSGDNTIDGTSNIWTVNYAILPKTLEFDFTSSVLNGGNQTFTIKTNNTDGKLTYSFKSSASPVNSEEPVLELYYAVSGTTGAGSINPNHATEPTEFLYKELKDSNGKHTAGKYVIYVVLADSSANPVNKNYRIKDPDAITAEMTAAGASTSDITAAVTAAKATYEKEITLIAGEASLNDLPIVYKEGDNVTNSDDPTALSFDYTNKKNLQYKLGSDGKTPVPYWIYFDLSGDFSFLEVVGAISYQYDAPATDTSPCNYDPYGAITSGSTASAGYAMRYAGKLTITVNVKVKDSEKSENKLPAQADYDALTDKVFTYTAGTPESNGNVYSGTLVFTYEIRKAEVDADKIKDTTLLQWKYSTDDDTKWKDYTATSFPEYNEIAQVDFKIDSTKYNSAGNGTLPGITGATLDSITNAAGQPEKQGPGKRYVTIAYTVDENNYEKVNHDNTTLTGKYKYEVEISPKVIDSSKITLTTWKESDGVTDKTNSLGVPYQIWELDLDDPTFANFIDYEYYLYDGGTNSVGALIGTNEQALLDLTNPSGPYAYLGIDGGSAAYIYVKPVINLTKVDKVNGEPKYALKDLSGNTDKDISGNDGYKKFEFGKQMTVIKVELVETESTYGDTFAATDIIKITMGGSVAAESTYNTKVYKDKIDDANLIGDLAAFCANSATLDAGKYIIKVTAVNDAMFVAVPATVNFEIAPKEIALPTLGEIVFSGSRINLIDYLTGFDSTMMQIGGNDYEDIRDVSKNGYSATITLTNANYCWAYPAAGASLTAKSIAKYSTADTEITPVTSSVAEYKWNITPLTVDTTNLWNKGKGGATLNLPQNVKALMAGDEPTLTVGYRYFDNATGEELPDVELKGGRSFKVDAVFGGYDADLGNVLFITKNADGSTSLSTTSSQTSYTVPQSGASAFLGNVKDFVTKTWMGLPIWAWFLIALVLIILLIIIIVVACKRRKTKEEKEAIKAAKEEEKQRKEEERQRREEEREEERRRREEEREEEKRRREEEREAAKAKQEAELELAKAKQEAELARIKAEAAAAAAVPAVAATAAMAAQPQQQVQQPQPVQQVQQVPVQDNSAIAKLEAEIAMLRAENKANAQQQQQQPQQPAADPNALARIEARLDAIQAEQRAKAAMQPQQQPMMQMPMMPMQQPMMQMPMQMPMYGPQPYGMGGGNGGSSNDPVMVAELTRLKAESEAHMRVELERARTETERAKADAEIAKARAESGRAQAQPQYSQPAPQPMYVQYAQPQQPQPQPAQQAQAQAPIVLQLPAQNGADSSFNAETVGAIMASMMKNMGGEKPKEQKTVIEAESQPTVANIPTVYPPDAVITTTTMVDTTKKPQSQPRLSREDTSTFDVDGFYDAFEDNK